MTALVPQVGNRPAAIKFNGGWVYLGVHDAAYLHERSAWRARLAQAHPDHGGTRGRFLEVYRQCRLWRRAEQAWYAAFGFEPPRVEVVRRRLNLLKTIEREVIDEAVRTTPTLAEAARVLGITHGTLRGKLQTYAIARKRQVACLLALLLWPSLVAAETLTLAWDASITPETTGYVVYVGNEPGVYTQTFTAGNVLTFAVNVTPGQIYCFAAAAYIDELVGEKSNEVCGSVGTPPPPPPPPPVSTCTWNGQTVAVDAAITVTVRSQLVASTKQQLIAAKFGIVSETAQKGNRVAIVARCVG